MIQKHDLPILEYDFDSIEVIRPNHGAEQLVLPEKCVFGFLGDVIDDYAFEMDAVIAEHFETITKSYPVYIVRQNGLEFCLCQAPLGAAAAAQFLDFLISCGCKKIISAGSCGVLTDLDENEFLIPIRAMRDEGTSYHYLPAARFVDLEPSAIKAIEQTFVAFEDQNYTMAEDVIKGDRNVNDMERAIESRCLSLILRQQPVARDLRQISTALKVVTDLERIGDHASDIAELILRIKSDHAYHIVQHLPAMAASAQKMVHDAVEAFIKQDVEEAEEIIRRDDEVDALFNQVKSDVVELLKSAPSHADQGIDLLMIAKYLERIGDHAVNVCEWTQFCKTGALKNVRIM